MSFKNLIAGVRRLEQELLALPDAHVDNITQDCASRIVVKFTQGDLLKQDNVDAIVNAVN